MFCDFFNLRKVLINKKIVIVHYKCYLLLQLEYLRISSWQAAAGEKFCSPGEGSHSLLLLLNLGERPEGEATEKVMQDLLKSGYVHYCVIDTINVNFT